jgi:hypothetical protein
MSLVEWRVAGASVAGFSHLADGTPCQDAHAIATTPSGWLIAVVSDGAGSAPRSSEGSRLLSDEVVAHICARCGAIDSGELMHLDEDTVRPWIEEAVEAVRAQLSALANNGGSLRDFHATLVGVVAGPDTGIFFHVGDGAGCATSLKDVSVSVVSGPENGEYANETYFITQDEWRDHLRLTSFNSKHNLIALMSDGVMPFALAKGALKPFPPFFDPLSKFLAERSREEGEKAIATILERDTIRQITGDDKTLVWALRVRADS